MVWTAPRTWVAGEVVTAAIMNTHVRDNLKALGDPWTAWTPVWTAATTNPTLGNGSLTGGFRQAGQDVNWWLQLVPGSTTTYGTGAYQFTFPVGETAHRWTFSGTARDASGAASYAIFAERTTSNTLMVRTLPTVAGNPYASVNPTNPFTWASTDELFLNGTYEAA